MVDSIDLKALRLRLGWSQARMAEILGLDRSGVSRMETGASGIKGPTRKLLEQLAAEETAGRAPADSAPVPENAAAVNTRGTGDGA